MDRLLLETRLFDVMFLTRLGRRIRLTAHEKNAMFIHFIMSRGERFILIFNFSLFAPNLPHSINEMRV